MNPCSKATVDFLCHHNITICRYCLNQAPSHWTKIVPYLSLISSSHMNLAYFILHICTSCNGPPIHPLCGHGTCCSLSPTFSREACHHSCHFSLVTWIWYNEIEDDTGHEYGWGRSTIEIDCQLWAGKGETKAGHVSHSFRKPGRGQRAQVLEG